MKHRVVPSRSATAGPQFRHLLSQRRDLERLRGQVRRVGLQDHAIQGAVQCRGPWAGDGGVGLGLG